MCAAFGCTDNPQPQYTTCSFSYSLPNTRVCTCGNVPNMQVDNGAGVFLPSKTLIGNAPWVSCEPIQYCATIGCGPFATCSLTAIGVRTCTCAAGKTSFVNGSLLGVVYTLRDAEPATGCPYGMHRKKKKIKSEERKNFKNENRRQEAKSEK